MRIAILTDSPFLPTGYSNAAKQLVQHLCKLGHEVHWLAHAYTGVTLDFVRFEDGTEFSCKIHGQNMGDMYFNQSLAIKLKELNIERFIILLDTFMLYPWYLNVDTSPAKTYFWYPSDGGAGLPKGCDAILKKMDVSVGMAKFAQKQVADYHGIKAEYIPLGLDPKRFYKLSDQDRNELRAKNGFADKFVIGVVARNQPRKALDRTIKSMRLIADQIPEAVLFLHLDPKDPAAPWQIHELVKRYNLENRVVYSGMQAFKGLGWDKMNGIYNMMDCFLLTTTGEGFGIPIIEAMACEVPVVATDYTTTPELVIENKAGLGIDLAGVETIEMPLKMKKPVYKTVTEQIKVPIKKVYPQGYYVVDGEKKNFGKPIIEYEIEEVKKEVLVSPWESIGESLVDYDIKVMNGTMTGSWEVERGLCSITDCAKKVKQIHDNPEEAKAMGLNGRKAVLENYTFDIVGKAWEELLE